MTCWASRRNTGGHGEVGMASRADSESVNPLFRPPQDGRPTRRRLLRYAAGIGATLLAAGAGEIGSPGAAVAWAEPIAYLWVSTRRAAPLPLNPHGTGVRRPPLPPP